MGVFTYLTTSTRQPEPEEAEIEIEIRTPDEIRAGEKLNVEVLLRTLHPTIKDRPAGDIRGEVTVVLGGAGEGEVLAVGLVNHNYVFGGQNVLLTGGHAEFVPESTGTYTFTPGTVQVITSDYPLTSRPKGEQPFDSKTEVV
ncbi:hypothetical protein [Streptomyces xiamenensis]|uniref:hypothetical protein n=1 Tax=Streptomyces xiamenensis TaxID=408015 RepID=UPI0037CFA27E